MRVFLAALAAFFVLATHASAQSVDLNPWMKEIVAPTAVTVASGVVSVVLSIGFGFLARKWGLDIEQRHRDSLHMAIMTGIGKAASQVGAVRIPEIRVDSAFTRIALQYAKRSAGDAIKKFDLSDDRVAEMIIGKLPQVLGDAARAAPVRATLPDPLPGVPKTSDLGTAYANAPRVGGKD
jgi:hypothetical protein